MLLVILDEAKNLRLFAGFDPSVIPKLFCFAEHDTAVDEKGLKQVYQPPDPASTSNKEETKGEDHGYLYRFDSVC